MGRYDPGVWLEPKASAAHGSPSSTLLMQSGLCGLQIAVVTRKLVGYI